ncbi:hypothetical protein E6C55_15045 [Cohnella fermenti]|uniref:Uncharacterized protein n=1 Tax=Cohnella fermenti TaxID=2565925 RepID=A0A4S4BUG7_9BACL|nr:hypothetical protein E6C55_15045 [Cohnella fermenti]
MRAQGSFYKEIVNTTRPDEVVTIEITKALAKERKKQGKDLAPGTALQVRVIKVELSTGETEILLTNVGAEELSYEACKPLYFKRWGAETGFDELKHKFEIENFRDKNLRSSNRTSMPRCRSSTWLRSWNKKQKSR